MWLPLAASIDSDPSGPLVHPVYGQMPAVCEGFAEASMNIEVASNLYIVPLTFIEDQVDSALKSPDSMPRVLQDRAQKHGAALLNRAPQQGPVHDSILRFVTTAVGYANAIVAAFEETLSYGRLFDAELESVEAAAVDAQGTVLADPTAAGDPTRYDTIALIELLYDDCAQMATTATDVAGSGLVDYYVPSTTHIAILATRFYGSDGLARIAEILANNPGRIPNPAAIAAGTTLRMAPPTASER